MLRKEMEQERGCISSLYHHLRGYSSLTESSADSYFSVSHFPLNIKRLQKPQKQPKLKNSHTNQPAVDPAHRDWFGSKVIVTAWTSDRLTGLD